MPALISLTATRRLTALGAVDLPTVFEEPPDEVMVVQPVGKPWLSRKGRRIDFARQDALNRQLGKLGEGFALDLGQRRLRTAGRDDLAGRVVWATEEWGDGLGFDVLSFCEDGDSELLIEVKTTGAGKFLPFYLTATELRCSDDSGEKFLLYRVFNFADSPRVYVLAGPLSDRCKLAPVLYRATI